MRHRAALMLLPLLVGAVLLMHGLDAGAHAGHHAPVAAPHGGHTATEPDAGPGSTAHDGAGHAAGEAAPSHSGPVLELGTLCLAVLLGATTAVVARRLGTLLRSRAPSTTERHFPSGPVRLGWPPWPASSPTSLCVLRC